jgi:hypothetical protein
MPANRLQFASWIERGYAQGLQEKRSPLPLGPVRNFGPQDFHDVIPNRVEDSVRNLLFRQAQ